MLLNVFEPVIVNAPAPPWLSVQLNVEPPPTKVFADEAVMEIVPVPVPAVVVKPVGAALLKAVVVAAEQITVPPLNVRFCARGGCKCSCVCKSIPSQIKRSIG